MNKWIAEFELEDGDTMPEHMDLEYKGARIDFHCKPLKQEPTTKNDLGVETTQMIDKSNFSQEQYKSDLQSAYDCGYAQAKNDLGVDCISRADAIHAVSEALKRTFVEYEDIANQVIGKLPSVTPQEPRKGHWITDAKTYYEELNKRGLRVDEYTPYFTDDIACSECLAKYSMLDNETQFFKHCPNCGADMREVEE